MSPCFDIERRIYHRKLSCTSSYSSYTLNYLVVFKPGSLRAGDMVTRSTVMKRRKPSVKPLLRLLLPLNTHHDDSTPPYV